MLFLSRLLVEPAAIELLHGIEPNPLFRSKPPKAKSAEGAGVLNPLLGRRVLAWKTIPIPTGRLQGRLQNPKPEHFREGPDRNTGNIPRRELACRIPASWR
jgi:hypothetical protein